MPFIHIKSLPFERDIDVESWLKEINQDFSDKTGIGLGDISVTWEFFQEGAYCVTGITKTLQPDSSHPILVDLLVPDFNENEKIERMMNICAKKISLVSGVDTTNVFVNCRTAKSGWVFDAGQIVTW